MRRLTNCSGFIFIETLLIVMLLSMAAMLVMRGLSGAQKINRDMAIKTIALHLANGVIAEYEYDKNKPECDNFSPDTSPKTFNNVLGDPNDIDKGMTVEFAIVAAVNDNNVTVTVTPTVNGTERADLTVSAEKFIIKK